MFDKGMHSQPYLNTASQFPMQSVPQYPSVMYPPQQYPNNNPWNPSFSNQAPAYNYQPQPIIIPSNYQDTTTFNLNNNPDYDQIRNTVQVTERRAKCRKAIIGIVVTLVIIGVILGIVLPIVLTANATFSYQLLPGYSFTGNLNCTHNFSIRLVWLNTGRDFDLAVYQPGRSLVKYSDRYGVYGTFQSDQSGGPTFEQYIAPCAKTGEFQILVRHFSSYGNVAYLPQINVIVNNVAGTLRKTVPWIEQDVSYFAPVAKFIISQNNSTKMWNFQIA